jgi:hypothetical protein
MKTGPVYLHLSRDGESPRLSTGGHSGPVFGPYRSIRFDDQQLIYMERDGAADILHISFSGVFYDGTYYSAWTVRSAPESPVAPYDRGRIEPDRSDESAEMPVEDRFRKLMVLCECIVEERLSILCEDDEMMRDMILTTEIDDQIAHWRAIEQELKDLK